MAEPKNLTEMLESIMFRTELNSKAIALVIAEIEAVAPEAQARIKTAIARLPSDNGPKNTEIERMLRIIDATP